MSNEKYLYDVSEADKLLELILNQHFMNQSDKTKVEIQGVMYTREEFKLKLLKELSDESSNNMINDTMSSLKESSEYFDSLQTNRKNKINDSIQDTIRLLKTVLNQSVELVKEISKSLDLEYSDNILKLKNDDLTKFILLKLHERSVEIFGEIILLIENGYSLGSLARWRTLNEYSIIMLVLEQNDNTELTLRYTKHEIVSFKKIADDLYKINKNRVPDYDEVMKEYDELIKTYGNDYKQPYGWYIDNPKINFNDLSLKYNANVLNGYFRKSSMTNHGSSFDIIGKNHKPFKELINDFETIVQNAVISMSIINNVLLLYFMKKENSSTIMLAAYVSYFNKINELIAKVYFTERKVIDDSKPSYEEMVPPVDE